MTPYATALRWKRLSYILPGVLGEAVSIMFAVQLGSLEVTSMANVAMKFL
jgi:hypothetical protein